MAKPVLAAFDFDETLIAKDSLLDFLRYSFNTPTFLIKSAWFIPTLVAFKTGRISNSEAKRRLLTLFLKGMDDKRFGLLCEAYVNRLEIIKNPEAIERLRWHAKKGHKTIIISASAEDWIKPWAARYGVSDVIATKLERKQGKLTGSLSGKNCHGPEKIVRLLKDFPDRGNYELYVYGDGKSDQDLFKVADRIFEKKFA
ncbi:MAG TPA: HAD-IB family hydrolase [Candidatus Saccharimonadales bacterium]|nr:HAD-IB family hydrolase [Candidatus Saccharimonadales bacterium]